jgi:hypothetical protein
MRRALIVMVLAIAAAAGTAAQAQGNTINQLSGTFANDPNSSISFGVKTDGDGAPIRVTPVHYSNVDLYCKDGSVTEISGTVPGHKVDRLDDGTPFFVVGTADSGGPVTHFQGTLNRRATKARGGLTAYTATFADGVTCATGQAPDVAITPDNSTSFSADLVGHMGTSHGGGNGVLTRHLTGRLYNDPSSSISFDVFVKNGEPVGVSDVTYENLHMNCSDGSTLPVSGVAPHNKNLIPTHKGLAFNAGVSGPPQAIHFTGYLSKSGKHAKGTFMGFTEGLACTTGDGPGPGKDVFKFFAN